MALLLSEWVFSMLLKRNWIPNQSEHLRLDNKLDHVAIHNKLRLRGILD